MNRLNFRLLLILALAVPVVVSASWFVWLDAPARSNPNDRKSPLYIPPTATPVPTANMTLTARASLTAGATMGTNTNTYTNTPQSTDTSTPTSTAIATVGGPSSTSTLTYTLSSSPTPPATLTPTMTPTLVVGAACPSTDHLDLQVTTSNGAQNPCSANYPEFAFKIVNNGLTAVNINTLTILGWMNGNVTLGYWGGDSWRTTVYSSTGVSQGTATGSLSTVSGTWGAMNRQITFGFTDSVLIPAGGYVLAGQNGIGGFYMLKNNDALFDPTCSNYSGLGGASFDTAWTYYQDPSWQLRESGEPVCEYTAPGTHDPATGIASGAVLCTCPGENTASPTPAAVNTSTPTPSPSPYFSPTYSPVPTATYTAGAGSSTSTPSNSPSPTVTPTATSSGSCVATDALDLQVGTTNAGQNPCTSGFPEFMFKIVNNSAVAVNVNTLSINAWFQGTITTGWGGDSWRTTVYNSTGVAQGTVTGSFAVSSGSWGAMNQQVTFGFTTSQLIPAGGYVLAGFAGNGFYMLMNGGGTFDPSCNDYSNLGAASFYTVNTYYQNNGFVLLEGGNPVCEYTAPGTHDPATGIPAGGASCNCGWALNTATATRTNTPVYSATGTPSDTPVFTPTITPSSTPSFTASPTSTPVGVCSVTDNLDLQVGTTNGAQNPCTSGYPEVMFKIVNNGASAVNVNTLTILGWFQGAITAGWGGDVWRTTVYNSTGVAQGTVTGSFAAASGSWGGMNQQVTFGFTTSQLIPAGGYVLAGFAGNGFYQMINGGGTFDPSCNDYTNLGGATFYTVNTYYQNSTWQLQESGAPVCEYTAPGVKDPATGIPAGGATCSCP
ncbi:MAG TPA: hypothetical protein VNZ54_03835 [bacterium]|nr:hypothetical protein [bacterium]